jgi:hypothetical protein
MMRTLFLFLAFLPSRVSAFAWVEGWDKFRKPVAGSATGFGMDFLNALACGWFNFVTKFIFFASISAIIWGATTMQGTAIEEGNKENGKKIIIGGLIGIVWAVLAESIVSFVYTFIGTLVGLSAAWPCVAPVVGP